MPKAKQRLEWVLVLAVWAVVIAGGESILLNYEIRPGSPAQPPQTWPLETDIQKSPERAALLMFVHPRCPCSRASLEELARLTARCGEKADIQIIFLSPGKQPASWTKTDLWEKAGAIPGVQVRLDKNGKEAKHFRVSTSGQTLLYGRDGQLLFNGGITASRGHSGDNAGRSALEDLLLKGASERSRTPVFGCSLIDQRAGFFERFLSLWKK